MEMLNRAEHSIDSWGTTVVTSFQLDFTPLIATPCGPSVLHVLCRPHYLLTQPILQQLLHEDITGDTAESLTDTSIYCPVYQASHFIAKNYQVGQEWLPLGKYVDYS